MGTDHGPKQCRDYQLNAGQQVHNWNRIFDEAYRQALERYEAIPMCFCFTIRDLLWLTVVVALAVAWGMTLVENQRLRDSDIRIPTSLRDASVEKAMQLETRKCLSNEELIDSQNVCEIVTNSLSLDESQATRKGRGNGLMGTLDPLLAIHKHLLQMVRGKYLHKCHDGTTVVTSYSGDFRPFVVRKFSTRYVVS